MKTGNDILTDIYKVIKDSPINDLDGGIWKKVRPTGSILQDCVISLISGATGKFLQDGALYVKLFYNDIETQDTYFEDGTTGASMESLLYTLSGTILSMNGYSFQIQSREIYTESVDEIKQHYAILKLNFKILV